MELLSKDMQALEYPLIPGKVLRPHAESEADQALLEALRTMQEEELPPHAHTCSKELPAHAASGVDNMVLRVLQMFQEEDSDVTGVVHCRLPLPHATAPAIMAHVGELRSQAELEPNKGVDLLWMLGELERRLDIEAFEDATALCAGGSAEQVSLLLAPRIRSTRREAAALRGLCAALLGAVAELGEVAHRKGQSAPMKASIIQHKLADVTCLSQSHLGCAFAAAERSVVELDEARRRARSSERHAAEGGAAPRPAAPPRRGPSSPGRAAEGGAAPALAELGGEGHTHDQLERCPISSPTSMPLSRGLHGGPEVQVPVPPPPANTRQREEAESATPAARAEAGAAGAKAQAKSPERMFLFSGTETASAAAAATRADGPAGDAKAKDAKAAAAHAHTARDPASSSAAAAKGGAPSSDAKPCAKAGTQAHAAGDSVKSSSVPKTVASAATKGAAPHVGVKAEAKAVAAQADVVLKSSGADDVDRFGVPLGEDIERGSAPNPLLHVASPRKGTFPNGRAISSGAPHASHDPSAGTAPKAAGGGTLKAAGGGTPKAVGGGMHKKGPRGSSGNG